MRLLPIIFLAVWVSGCLKLPQDIEPVDGFELNKYLGKWYEIARLDHSFERGLDNVTAEYFLRDDGGVKVINKGFSTAENKWKEAEGKAYFVRDPQQGYLKVSFSAHFMGLISYLSWTKKPINTPSSLAMTNRICGCWQEPQRSAMHCLTSLCREPQSWDLKQTS